MLDILNRSFKVGLGGLDVSMLYTKPSKHSKPICTPLLILPPTNEVKMIDNR